MELDELKDAWKRAEKNQKPLNTDIMELIQHKSYGPVAALKKRFRKQMILIPLMLVLVINSLSRRHQIMTDLLFWSYVIFCLSMSAYFYLNYRLVKKLEFMDCMIKSNLEQQIHILEKRLKWHLIAVRAALVFFIILSELLPLFQQEPMLEKWHIVPFTLRLVTYAALITFQYFVSRALSQHKYGQHLTYLKRLVNELQ